MGLNYALLNGASGMRATQTAINTVSHNLANSETEGYSRQRVFMSSQPGSASDPSRGGRGATIEKVTRVSDRFVSEQVRRDRNLLGFFTSREQALQSLESVYSEDIAPSINTGFDSFFNNLRDLTRDPANRGARAQFLSGAQGIVDVFRNVHEDLRRLQIGIDQDLAGRLGEVNDLAARIAQLNTEVVAAGGASLDFEDKRDQAIRRLSELVSVSVVEQGTGSVHVQLDGVGTIVQDGLSAEIKTLPDPANRRVARVVLTGIGAAEARDVTDKITRGEVGGLLALRDQTIGALLTDINALAQEFSDALNAQHAAGFDLNGDRGQALFTFKDPAGDPAANIQVSAAVAANTDLLAISSSALRDPVTGAVTAGVPGDALNGIAMTDLQYMTRTAIAGVQAGSTYTGRVQVGGSYNASIGSTPVTLTAVSGGAPGAVTFRVDGLPAAAGVEDNGGVGYSVAQVNTLLSSLGVNLNLDVNGSSFTAGDRVNLDLVTRPSTFNRKVAETLQFVGQTAKFNYEQADIHVNRLQQSEKLMESVVGVSIDEELLDLTRFEKQFAANGKVIQTVNELMDSILQLVG
ncbi:MAG: flagellar hook-associated protein FlgK [Deltaproteobacteria bacterium]|nr:flagellar hook-associated protein FlgK [Deltaproteobacteria bacterium]